MSRSPRTSSKFGVSSKGQEVVRLQAITHGVVDERLVVKAVPEHDAHAVSQQQALPLVTADDVAPLLQRASSSDDPGTTANVKAVLVGALSAGAFTGLFRVASPGGDDRPRGERHHAWS